MFYFYWIVYFFSLSISFYCAYNSIKVLASRKDQFPMLHSTGLLPDFHTGIDAQVLVPGDRQIFWGQTASAMAFLLPMCFICFGSWWPPILSCKLSCAFKKMCVNSIYYFQIFYNKTVFHDVRTKRLSTPYSSPRSIGRFNGLSWSLLHQCPVHGCFCVYQRFKCTRIL